MSPIGEFQNTLHQATIMIVDDEPINIEVVQAFLEEEGYQNFVTVDDSARAVAVLEETRPDLLLLGLMMPEVTGFDILEAVRRHPRFKHLPVIILTASTDIASKLAALDLGATDFLAKPLDPCELGLRVRNTLGAKAYQDQLAYYDPLTRLPNRQLFLEELSWALKGLRRQQAQLALLSIEVDHFDQVNDTIGLNAGDEVLRLVVERIQSVVRSVDLLGRGDGGNAQKCGLFRLDGGIFSLILDRMESPESAAVVADRILRTLREPMVVEGRELYVTASIGIAVCPGESDEVAGLLRLASSARDFAKKSGGDAFQFSSRAINEMYDRRLQMETRLRRALENGEFILHYQPKVEVGTGAIVGVEALIRWQNDGVLVPPGEFIPLAEEIGLIVPIGEWGLREACRQLTAWHGRGHVIGMAVNISVKQFTDPGFVPGVKAIIEQSGIDPRFLTLELTESHMLGDIDTKIKLLKSLKDLGLKLSIDDFGTGYSSLSYLRKLPLDELKIDRSFIMEVCAHADSRAIVATIIFLARSLNLHTVAEGIEREEELDFLREQSCNQFQGYLFSRPLPAGDLLALLERHSAGKATAPFSPPGAPGDPR